MKLVTGAGGFIGGHLVKSLLDMGHEVKAVDKKRANHWFLFDDRAENWELNMADMNSCYMAVEDCDAVYNLAADMGGMGFIETHKAACMLSVLISTNVLLAARDRGVERYFYSSSACVYPDYKQTDADVTALKESDAYPAMPEDGYGWEKLFSERMCRHFREDYDIETRIARFHNVYGPHTSYDGGREKAPAAICRKVILAQKDDDPSIEIWGDGEQTRSFMYIDDCIEGIHKIMDGDYADPVNLGSSELVTINQLVDLAESFAGTKLMRHYNLDAPKGVRGRNSDNTLIKELYGWEPSISLHDGLFQTYEWIKEELYEAGRGVLG